MGAVYHNNDPSSLLTHHLNDLKVKIKSSSLIISSASDITATAPPRMFLSNIDQVLNFDVQTIHFFEGRPDDFPPELVVEKIRSALEKVLEFYPFLAGRMGTNPEQNGRFEFVCNNAGIGFVVAESERSLEEVGDLVYPNPAFEQLLTFRLDDDDLTSGHPLCIVQVTSFKCGGFAMGVQTNHATFDGSSFKTFLENLAALAADKPLAVNPCNDRHLLAARSPPRVSFPHHELLKLNTSLGQNTHAEAQPPTSAQLDSAEAQPPTSAEQDSTEPAGNQNVFEDTTTHDFEFKVFRLSADQINQLKSKATEDVLTLDVDGSNCKPKVTGFNVVSAHIWRCKALSFNPEKNDPERESTLLFAIDIRPRLSPPLPAEFTGNAVLTSYATAKCGEIEKASLGRLVQIITEGNARMTDEYARSAIDWGEENKGFPNGEFLISSWWRLGLDKVQYPWGRPKYSCPLVHRRKDIVLLFPDYYSGPKVDDDCRVGGEGVNVLVALPHNEMVKFDSLFPHF